FRVKSPEAGMNDGAQVVGFADVPNRCNMVRIGMTQHEIIDRRTLWNEICNPPEGGFSSVLKIACVINQVVVIRGLDYAAQTRAYIDNAHKERVGLRFQRENRPRTEADANRHQSSSFHQPKRLLRRCWS